MKRAWMELKLENLAEGNTRVNSRTEIQEELVIVVVLACSSLAFGRLGRLASERSRVCTELDGVQRLSENVCDHVSSRDVRSRDHSSSDELTNVVIGYVDMLVLGVSDRIARE